MNTHYFTKNLIAVVLIAVLFSSCDSKSDETRPVYKDITETVFASGTLEPDHKYNLTAQSDGYILSLNFKEGDLIKANEVMAVIDNKQNVFNEQSSQELLAIAQKNVSADAPALKQTQLNIELAKEKLKQDELQFNRYKKLLESKAVSKLEFENVSLGFENSKTNLAALQQTFDNQKLQAEQQLVTQQGQRNVNDFLSSNNQIKAFVSGMVYKKMKEQGDYVKKGDVIAVIGNPDFVYAKLNVDESNISKIKIGQQAIVQLNTNKEQQLKGTVFEILPSFEEATQSFICKVKFNDSLPLKISGTQLQANIAIGKKAKALVIPRAFLDYGNKVIVKGKDEPMVVKTGFISSDWVEIISGLNENDVIQTAK